MAFCTNCGRQLEDGSTFCPYCGVSLVGAQQPQPQQPQYQPQYQQPMYAQPVYTVKRKIPGRGFGITSMVLGIIAVFYSFIGLIYSIAVPSVRIDYYGYYYDYVSVAEEATFTALMIYAGILTVLALVFGLVSIGRGFRKGQSISGTVLGGISLLLMMISIIVFNV